MLLNFFFHQLGTERGISIRFFHRHFLQVEATAENTHLEKCIYTLNRTNHGRANGPWYLYWGLLSLPRRRIGKLRTRLASVRMVFNPSQARGRPCIGMLGAEML